MQKEITIIDAEGKSLGRVASQAARLLRGKEVASYERHIIPSQCVVIKNAALIRFTGRKFREEAIERYSGYPGGLRKVSYETTFKKDPRRVVENAISGMIPRNRIKKSILKNLTIYARDEK